MNNAEALVKFIRMVVEDGGMEQTLKRVQEEAAQTQVMQEDARSRQKDAHDMLDRAEKMLADAAVAAKLFEEQKAAFERMRIDDSKSYDANNAAMMTLKAELEKREGDLDARKIDLDQREFALNEKDAALEEEIVKLEKDKADYQEKVTRLQEAVQ